MLGGCECICLRVSVSVLMCVQVWLDECEFFVRVDVSGYAYEESAGGLRVVRDVCQSNQTAERARVISASADSSSFGYSTMMLVHFARLESFVIFR